MLTMPPKKKEEPRDVPLGLTLDPDIRAAIDAYIADHNEKHDHRATVKSTVEGALKKYLKDAGFWPPKK